MPTIGLYLTKSGKEAINLKVNTSPSGTVSYSWIGEYGAGSGGSLADYLAMIERFKKTKRGMQTVIDAASYREN